MIYKYEEIIYAKNGMDDVTTSGDPLLTLCYCLQPLPPFPR